MPQAYDYYLIFPSFALYCPAPHFPGHRHRLSQSCLRSTGTSM